MMDTAHFAKISDISAPAVFFEDEKYQQQVLEFVRENLAYPETVDILSQKVRCLRGGTKEDCLDKGTSFEEYQKLVVLDAIARTIGGDIELANKLDTIYFFDDSYGNLGDSPSSAVFGLTEDDHNFIAFCQDNIYSFISEGTPVVQWLAHSGAHETQHFIQWSEGRLDRQAMLEIHRHDEGQSLGYKDKLPTNGVMSGLQDIHTGSKSHPLEKEAEDRASEIDSQMGYLY